MSNANKVAASNARLKAVADILGNKRNTERQLRNRNAISIASNNNRNRALLNDYNQSLVDFYNQRKYMDYLQAVNLSEDLSDINEQLLRRKEQEAMLEVLRPYYNRFGMFDKYAPQYS